MVARHHLDVIEPHLAAQVAQYFSAVFEFDPELGVRKGLGDDSVYLGQWVIGHVLTVRGLFYQAQGVKIKQELAASGTDPEGLAGEG